MNKNKPQGYVVREKYSRYLSKHGASDIWARELLNGLFEIDDRQPSVLSPHHTIEHDEFLSNYELFEEINNG